MVADLLQAHEQRENDPSTLDAVGGFELLGEFVYRLLVKGGLLAAQESERLPLGLVGQVRDDALVGLQSPQNIGAHQIAERTVWVLRAIGEPIDAALLALGRSEQAGM